MFKFNAFTKAKTMLNFASSGSKVCLALARFSNKTKQIKHKVNKVRDTQFKQVNVYSYKTSEKLKELFYDKKTNLDPNELVDLLDNYFKLGKRQDLSEDRFVSAVGRSLLPRCKQFSGKALLKLMKIYTNNTFLIDTDFHMLVIRSLRHLDIFALIQTEFGARDFAYLLKVVNHFSKTMDKDSALFIKFTSFKHAILQFRSHFEKKKFSTADLIGLLAVLDYYKDWEYFFEICEELSRRYKFLSVQDKLSILYLSSEVEMYYEPLVSRVLQENTLEVENFSENQLKKLLSFVFVAQKRIDLTVFKRAYLRKAIDRLKHLSKSLTHFQKIEFHILLGQQLEPGEIPIKLICFYILHCLRNNEEVIAFFIALKPRMQKLEEKFDIFERFCLLAGCTRDVATEDFVRNLLNTDTIKRVLYDFAVTSGFISYVKILNFKNHGAWGFNGKLLATVELLLKNMVQQRLLLTYNELLNIALLIRSLSLHVDEELIILLENYLFNHEDYVEVTENLILPQRILINYLLMMSHANTGLNADLFCKISKTEFAKHNFLQEILYTAIKSLKTAIFLQKDFVFCETFIADVYIPSLNVCIVINHYHNFFQISDVPEYFLEDSTVLSKAIAKKFNVTCYEISSELIVRNELLQTWLKDKVVPFDLA